MLYAALTTAGPFDIGEFESAEAAEQWARGRFGASLEAVVEQPTTSVDVVASSGPGVGLLLLGGLVLLAVFKPRGASYG